MKDKIVEGEVDLWIDDDGSRGMPDLIIRAEDGTVKHTPIYYILQEFDGKKVRVTIEEIE